jgi:predicted PurR-regulated permease PerM
MLYLVANQVLGSVLEPRIMGRGFGVSPVVILLSLVFWGWVLGPVGMLLSVPLTMGLRVVLGTLREGRSPVARSDGATGQPPFGASAPGPGGPSDP